MSILKMEHNEYKHYVHNGILVELYGPNIRHTTVRVCAEWEHRKMAWEVENTDIVLLETIQKAVTLMSKAKSLTEEEYFEMFRQQEVHMQDYNENDEVVDKLLAEIDELEKEIAAMKKQFERVAEDAKADVLEDIANNIGENISVLAFGLKDLAREHREKADELAGGMPRVKIDPVLV